MSAELLGRLFEAIDAKNTAAFVECLTADARFRFGSAPAVTGRAAISAAVDAFFASLAGLEHVLHRTLDDGVTLVCEGEVTYTRHDGHSVTLPFANVLERQGALIKDYRIYADTSPLFAE